ncbi:MAG: hypothetical protein ACYDBQ_10535 [Thermoplasmatota archaeon]
MPKRPDHQHPDVFVIVEGGGTDIVDFECDCGYDFNLDRRAMEEAVHRPFRVLARENERAPLY